MRAIEDGHVFNMAEDLLSSIAHIATQVTISHVIVVTGFIYVTILASNKEFREVLSSLTMQII